jgi:enamine deaminase RidA (YjgF/YER057c/UK114 family)
MTESPRELILLDDNSTPPANFSHAVRVGSQVFVAGMVSSKDGQIVGKGDAAAQTRQVIENIETALQRAGSNLRDVVRYRVYLTDMADLPAVRSVLTPAFGSIRPAGTLVAVSALVDPDLKIEIDVDAIVGSALPVAR